LSDKRVSLEEMVGELRDGMTIGIGGWGSRRKPMAAVRAIGRSSLRDLTVVSYGGPDVGILCAKNKVRKVVFGFVTLDSIALDPFFRRARQDQQVGCTELDEGMLYLGLLAAAQRMPFLPTRSGLGSDVIRVNPDLRTVLSPYEDGEELVAVPALKLDAAFVHANRADTHGNAQLLGPDPYFDDVFLSAADLGFVTAERVVAPGELPSHGPLQSIVISRLMTDAVCETPRGAHFTSCAPDYGRDETFQRSYAKSAADEASWQAFATRYLDVDEAGYQAALGAASEPALEGAEGS
jgi:glutaconate CoA-transferase, subunit A